jgi:hypothetical protein
MDGQPICVSRPEMLPYMLYILHINLYLVLKKVYVMLLRLSSHMDTTRIQIWQCALFKS